GRGPKDRPCLPCRQDSPTALPRAHRARPLRARSRPHRRADGALRAAACGLKARGPGADQATPGLLGDTMAPSLASGFEPRNLPSDSSCRVLATFSRSETEELRISLERCQGKPFVGLRIWFLDKNGEWHPTKRGVSIRCREFSEVA